MGIIKKLVTAEIQKIAAGQVVERPASVVKELIENSLDASATAIQIYIEQGGHSLIRVVDNGCGMDAEDARMCLENHATSKISRVDDLSSLITHGFRGEAIASIAAVSRFSLSTIQENQSIGTMIVSQEGIIQDVQQVALPQGTDVRVHDLFFNIPARRKFLKKEESELRAIIHIFQALALSYPTVSFQLFSNTNSLYHCPATTSLKNRAIQILDERAIHQFLLLEETEHHGIKISGILSNPHVARYNKNQIFTLVNHRWIKNYTIINSFIKGYANTLPDGKFPVGVINLIIDPQLIDINVDPRKEEIRFAHPRHVEHLVTQQVVATLEQHLKKSTTMNPDTPMMSQKFSDTHGLSSLLQPALSPVSHTPQKFSSEQREQQEPPRWQNIPTAAFDAIHMNPAHDLKTDALTKKNMMSEESLHQQQFIFDKREESLNVHILGILHATYILIQQPDGLTLIDQHAAHERVLFEQFAQRFGTAESIPLLFPTVVSITPDQRSQFFLIQPLLQGYGIEIDYVGQNELLVCATPVHLKHLDYQEFLAYVFACASKYESLEKKDFHQQLQHDLQAQMACKAAIKAGDQIQLQQAEQLVRDLYATPQCFSCPHGRPTIWTMNISELEKKFKRKM